MSIPESKRPAILVVDDTPANLSLLSNLLKDQYRIIVASNGIKALELANSAVPDLILLDVMMPKMDGYEVCRRLKAEKMTHKIPVIFLTAKTEIEDEELGFSVGAVDFIHKPISPPIVKARVKTQLEVKAWQDFLQDRVEQQLLEINNLQYALICVMVSLVEFRAESTGNHVRRIQNYVLLLGKEMAKLPHYSELLTPRYIEQMGKSAPLHDIGKIAIPDNILLKADKLTPEEFAIMKTHAQRGCDMLKKAGEYISVHGEFLKIAMDITCYHHEKWDGSGYPKGLVGSAIPLSARLMAVADVFDELISRRPYQKPVSIEQAIAVISEGKGTYFDPEVVDAFIAIKDEIQHISAMWADD